LRRIQVLRPALRRRAQHPPAERDHPAGRIRDREDQPVPEPVVRLGPALAPLDQPGLEQDLVRDAVAGRRVAQPRPFVGRVAQQEALGRLTRDATPLEIAPRHFADRLVSKLPLEVVGRERDRLVQRPEALVLRAPPPGLRDLDADALRDLTHRVVEAEPAVLHQEREHVPGFAAAEALVEALRGHDVERRRLLLVERAQRAEILAGTFQRHVLADDLHDVGPQPDLVHYFVRDHSSSTIVTPVPPSAGTPGRNDLTRRSARSVAATTSRSAPVPLPWMMRSVARSARTASSTARSTSPAASSARSPRRSTCGLASTSGALQPTASPAAPAGRRSRCASGSSATSPFTGTWSRMPPVSTVARPSRISTTVPTAPVAAIRTRPPGSGSRPSSAAAATASAASSGVRSSCFLAACSTRRRAVRAAS